MLSGLNEAITGTTTIRAFRLQAAAVARQDLLIDANTICQLLTASLNRCRQGQEGC